MQCASVIEVLTRGKEIGMPKISVGVVQEVYLERATS